MRSDRIILPDIVTDRAAKLLRRRIVVYVNKLSFRYCNTAITSDIYTHIFKEYKAKMAESIENDLI